MSKIPFGLVLLLVVFFGLGWGAAFAAGATYARASAPQASAASAAVAASGLASTPAGGSGRFSAGAASGTAEARDAIALRGTMGVVEQAGADRLMVRGAAGRVTVLLRPETVVRRVAEGGVADVREGSVVLVSGQRSGSGDVEASGVIVLPPEFAGGERSGGERRRPENQRP